MINSISKPKTSRDFPYVLKTSQLAEALLEADINIYVDLNYVQNKATVFSAYYWLPNQKVPYPRVYISVGVVHKDFYMNACRKMSESVIPLFVDWLQGILCLPENSPLLYSKPYFNATFADNRIAITKYP